MADTYTSLALDISFASGKSMWSLFNGSATKVIRVYRIWCMNACPLHIVPGVSTNASVNIHGFLTTLGVMKTSSSSGGLNIVPVKHDSNNANLDAAVISRVDAAVTDVAMLRQIMFSNDETGTADSNFEGWEILIPLNAIWEVGYANAGANKALTLRQDQGVSVKHLGAGAGGGKVDIFSEFTQV